MRTIGVFQVRDILQEKYSVDVDKYKTQIREFVDEIVSATNPSWCTQERRTFRSGSILVTREI